MTSRNLNLQWQQNQVSTRKRGLANYKIIREVESSPYQLFKARRIVDRLFCIIKRIDLSALTEEEKLLSFNEVKVLASLKCQYIVTCYDSFTEGNSLYVVVEYTHMGSLKKKLAHQRGKLLCERSVWKYFLQIAAAVLNMNQNSILHGSLQLQSIFLNSKDDIRLSNFGRAIRLSNTTESGRQRRKKGVTYNTKTEMLSLGHVLYEICTLKSVNDSKSHQSHHGHGQAGGIGNGHGGPHGVHGAHGGHGGHGTSVKANYSDLPAISQHYSPELESLVKDLLSTDPTQRPSIQELWTSPLVRNKALTSNVQMPKVFFPQLQVLNEMKNKYSSGKRHWSRISGQERNSRGRNNFPLADAIRQIKWDNASNMGMTDIASAGLELHDYNGEVAMAMANQNQMLYHPINGDINGDYMRKQNAQGQGQRVHVHAQDLRTKVESDWIGHRGHRMGMGMGYPEGGVGGMGSSDGSMAIMRKGDALSPHAHSPGMKAGPGPGSVAGQGGMHTPTSLKVKLQQNAAQDARGLPLLKDELDNWMASEGNGTPSGQGQKKLSSREMMAREPPGETASHMQMRKERERESHKLDRCIKFLVMGPIGPWADNDDLLKNEFTDYVASEIYDST